MKNRIYRPYVIAICLGLLSAVYANKPVPESFQGNPTVNKCDTYYQCNVYDHMTGTIDPCCCTFDPALGCEDYAIDTWQCAAGGTLYRNFRASSGPYPNSTCAVYTDGGYRCQ